MTDYNKRAMSDAEIREHFDSHALYALEGKHMYWPEALRFARALLASRPAVVSAEPTVVMLNAARDWSVKKYGIGIGNDAAIGCWKAMHAVAVISPADHTPTREDEQRARMQNRFAGRATTPATADFDLPAESDQVASQAPIQAETMQCPDCCGAGIYMKAAIAPPPPDVTCNRCGGSGKIRNDGAATSAIPAGDQASAAKNLQSLVDNFQSGTVIAKVSDLRAVLASRSDAVHAATLWDNGAHMTKDPALAEEWRRKRLPVTAYAEAPDSKGEPT